MMKDDKSLIYISFVLLSLTLLAFCVLSSSSGIVEKQSPASHRVAFKYVGYKTSTWQYHPTNKYLSRSDQLALKHAYLAARHDEALRTKDIEGFNTVCKSCLVLLFLFGISYSYLDKRFGSRVSHSIAYFSQFNLVNTTTAATAKESIDPLTEGFLLMNNQIEVIMPLGAGGMSTTYLAKLNEKKLVCLKETIIPPHIDDDLKNKWRQAIEREATLLAKLDHGQIARVLNSFYERSRHYLVLDYVPGITLREYVRMHGAQSGETVLRWAHDIACILDFLHSQSPAIVHRDLTPDNIVVKADKTLVLIDFGAAIEFKGPITGTSIGKRCYMPLEQFRGKSTPASDIYALGATMHFLLTAEEPIALSASHPAAINKTVSPDIDLLVAKCTQLLEQERITCSKDLLLRIKENLRVYDCPSQTVLFHAASPHMQTA
jgi:tRNA A-37 threonylcarbamoyl transferase component Bud32